MPRNFIDLHNAAINNFMKQHEKELCGSVEQQLYYLYKLLTGDRDTPSLQKTKTSLKEIIKQIEDGLTEQERIKTLIKS